MMANSDGHTIALLELSLLANIGLLARSYQIAIPILTDDG